MGKGIIKTILRMAFYQIDFKVTYTTIAIVVLVIDMGRLTLAVKCSQFGASTECTGGKVCIYKTGELDGDRCKNAAPPIDEIGKCIKVPAQGMESTPENEAATACKNFNNKKCESTDKTGCPGNKCKYTKSGGAVTYTCAETDDCENDDDTCCMLADDAKTGVWVKDANGPSECKWKSDAKGPTKGQSGSITEKPESPSPSPSASTSSEYLKMPLWAA